jgi:hypothetical protein
VQTSIVEKFKPEDVVVLGLARNITTYQWLINYVAQNRITFDMLYNADEVVEMYGAYSDPTYVLIDKDGQIRLRESAYYSYRIMELIILIQQLIEGF